MRIKFFMGFALALALFVSLASASWAQVPERVKHADRNKDGVVDRKEIVMENKWEHKQRAKVNTPAEKKLDVDHDGVVEPKEARLGWKKARAKVNTPIEQKYDKNGNGWLEPDEAREMLRDKMLLIKTNGKAKVDTELEAKYDTNKDGILDPDEAAVMEEDLK